MCQILGSTLQNYSTETLKRVSALMHAPTWISHDIFLLCFMVAWTFYLFFVWDLKGDQIGSQRHPIRISKKKEIGRCFDLGCAASSAGFYFKIVETLETAGCMQGVAFNGVDPVSHAVNYKGYDWLINSLPYNYSQLQGEAFILLHQQHVWAEQVQAPPTHLDFFRFLFIFWRTSMGKWHHWVCLISFLFLFSCYLCISGEGLRWRPVQQMAPVLRAGPAF